MVDLPPLLRDQRVIDTDQLRLLSIFHFLVAGLSLAGLGFLGLHFVVMRAVLESPEIWKLQQMPQPPAELFTVAKLFYVFGGCALVAVAAANFFSGLYIRRRRYRIFSLVVAAVDCLQVPFGTVLGVFTFIVLLRDSVRETYED